MSESIFKILPDVRPAGLHAKEIKELIDAKNFLLTRGGEIFDLLIAGAPADRKRAAADMVTLLRGHEQRVHKVVNALSKSYCDPDIVI